MRQRVNNSAPGGSFNGGRLLKTKTIGDRLRWVIEKHMRISQSDFARKMKKSRQLVNRWLNDPEHPPEEKSLERIAEMSGVSQAWIRYGEGEPLPGSEGIGSLDAVVLETAIHDAVEILLKAVHVEMGQKAKTTDLIDISPDVMAILNQEGQVLRAGQQWTQALSWPKEEIEGKRWEDLSHPGDVKDAKLAFSITRDQGAIVEFDGRAKNKEGDYRLFRWRVANDQGKIVAAGREVGTGEPLVGMRVITRGETE